MKICDLKISVFPPVVSPIWNTSASENVQTEAGEISSTPPPIRASLDSELLASQFKVSPRRRIKFFTPFAGSGADRPKSTSWISEANTTDAAQKRTASSQELCSFARACLQGRMKIYLKTFNLNFRVLYWVHPPLTKFRSYFRTKCKYQFRTYFRNKCEFRSYTHYDI